MSGSARTRYEDGRTPAEPVKAEFPACVLCTWRSLGWRQGYELKYLNRSCPDHKTVVAAEDSAEPVSIL